jgi:hypothetical protein
MVSAVVIWSWLSRPRCRRRLFSRLDLLQILGRVFVKVLLATLAAELDLPVPVLVDERFTLI